VNAEDLDLTASRDRRRGRRGQSLQGTVVRQRDRAVAALADAHRDPSRSADQVPQGGGLAAFGPPQSGEYGESHAGAEGAERERHGGPAHRAEPKRNRTEQPADAEHREESEKHGHHGRIVRPCRAYEGHSDVRHADGQMKANVHATADARKEKERRA
jgi:hypothetical protein